MPRHPRIQRPHLVHHAIARFTHGEFRIKDDAYRSEYFRRLGESLAKCDWRALSACAMCSHTHLALLAGLDPMERLFRSFHTGYAMWLNRKDETFGPVFAERPALIAFEGDNPLPLVAYHHNNPVHANLVQDPADSNWSTHRAYLGLEPAPPWLDVERGLSLCGFDSSPSGRARFHDAVCRLIHDRPPDLGSAGQRDARRNARDATGAPVETATPLVRAEGPQFDLVARAPVPLRARWEGSADTVIAATAVATNLRARVLRSRCRERRVVRARRIALAAWVCILGRRACEMACALGISDSGAARLAAYQVDDDAFAAAEAVARSVKAELG